MTDAMTTTMPSDAALIAGLQAGDADAFETLVRKYMPVLLDRKSTRLNSSH